MYPLSTSSKITFPSNSVMITENTKVCAYGQRFNVWYLNEICKLDTNCICRLSTEVNLLVKFVYFMQPHSNHKFIKCCIFGRLRLRLQHYRWRPLFIDWNLLSMKMVISSHVEGNTITNVYQNNCLFSEQNFEFKFKAETPNHNENENWLW